MTKLLIDFHIKSTKFPFHFFLSHDPWKTASMKQIPIKEFDEEVNVIVIRKPKHSLQVGAVFQSLKKLEILRIIESNVPAIGMHSFWGVPSLRTLGKLKENLLPASIFTLCFPRLALDLSKNNITSISDDNFKGQQNLLELNLSKNKMDQIPSGTFKYLIVSVNLFCKKIKIKFSFFFRRRTWGRSI